MRDSDAEGSVYVSCLPSFATILRLGHVHGHRRSRVFQCSHILTADITSFALNEVLITVFVCNVVHSSCYLTVLQCDLLGR